MAYVAPTTANAVAGSAILASDMLTVMNDIIDHETYVSPFRSAWSTWSPSYGNITVGNGTVTARYMQSGKTVIGSFYMLFGSTSAVAGDAYFSLPVTTYNDALVAATVSMYNPTGTTAGWVLGGYECASGRIYLRALNATGTYVALNTIAATVPGTWATNSQIRAQFRYESA